MWLTWCFLTDGSAGLQIMQEVKSVWLDTIYLSTIFSAFPLNYSAQPAELDELVTVGKNCFI